MNIHRVQTVGDQFNRIVIHGDTVYLSGLVADKASASFEDQCGDVFSTLDALLLKAGSSRSHLLSTTVYLKNFKDYAEFRQLWAGWLGVPDLPARATVRADLRDPGLLIEIQAIAATVDCAGQ